MNKGALPYRLGLPAWAFSGWKNKYFTDEPSALASYASVFNTVEGNTSFYQTPSKEKVAFWAEQLKGRDFKICFKLPQGITHSHQPCWQELSEFLTRLEPLSEFLGPLLLVFPARLGPEQISFIRAILLKLPKAFSYVIEVRHKDFFVEDNAKENAKENALTPLLYEFNTHRVVLDSRPLYKGDQSHPDVVKAKHEKPNVPVLPKVYNGLAYVRLVMHPSSENNASFISQWSKMVATYLMHDIEVYFSLHCPNNVHCPHFAHAFHKSLQKHSGNTSIPDLPKFPVPMQTQLL